MKIEKIIYDWVKEQYGQSEADEPSWCIEALAAHIEKQLTKGGQNGK